MAALAIDREVVLATPVDTGRARSNWIVQVNTPVRAVREPFSPGVRLGLGESANAQGALQQGEAAITAREPGQDIFISNNVPYIIFLNEGSSAQAGAGFVQRAVQLGASVVRTNRILT